MRYARTTPDDAASPRGNSNTANNLRRTGVAALSFIPDDRAMLENCVVLGFPGESTEEKMKDSIFALLPSRREGSPGGPFSNIVGEAVHSHHRPGKA